MSLIEILGLTVIVIVIAGALGFAVGRRVNIDNQEAIRQLTEEHEQQMLQKQAELDAYRDKVHAHFDKTAGLFVSMAGSYKELFDHLSAGYDQLGELGMENKLPERAGALLDGPEVNEAGAGDEDQPGPDYSRMNSTASQKDY